jgi:hypothetical protein
LDSNPEERYDCRTVIFSVHALMEEHHLNYEPELISEQQAQLDDIFGKANTLFQPPSFDDDHLADSY